MEWTLEFSCDPPIGVLKASILLYYDGPQLVHAVNPTGQRFIGLGVAEEDGHEVWLFAPVTANRLRRFLHNDLPIRDIFTECEVPWVYHIDWIWNTTTPVGHVQLLPLTDLTEDWLPRPQFYLRRKEQDKR